MNKSATIISINELVCIFSLARLSQEKAQQVFEGTPINIGGVEYKCNSCGVTAVPLDGSQYKSPLGDMFA